MLKKLLPPTNVNPKLNIPVVLTNESVSQDNNLETTKDFPLLCNQTPSSTPHVSTSVLPIVPQEPSYAHVDICSVIHDLPYRRRTRPRLTNYNSMSLSNRYESNILPRPRFLHHNPLSSNFNAYYNPGNQSHSRYFC